MSRSYHRWTSAVLAFGAVLLVLFASPSIPAFVERDEAVRTWSLSALAAGWVVPLATPLVIATLRDGPLSRKVFFVALAFALSWLATIAVFWAIVVPAIWSDPVLSAAIATAAEPSSLLTRLRSATEVITRYWYFAWVFLVPPAAALLSLPASVLLARRLLPRPASAAREA